MAVKNILPPQGSVPFLPVPLLSPALTTFQMCECVFLIQTAHSFLLSLDNTH